MSLLDRQLLIAALRVTGENLIALQVTTPIRLVVVGGTAGLLGGLLNPSRTTGDCDVVWKQGDEAWAVLSGAARIAALTLGLPQEWLNRDATVYAHCLPLGWDARAVPVARFGPLDVRRIDRADLIAGKVVSAPDRPQDLADLRDLAPSATELNFAERNLERLAAESLDGERFDEQRRILAELRGPS